ncbi:hypothetical protein LXL04_023769 [Taraxacum kok-saghyz]
MFNLIPGRYRLMEATSSTDHPSFYSWGHFWKDFLDSIWLWVLNNKRWQLDLATERVLTLIRSKAVLILWQHVNKGYFGQLRMQQNFYNCRGFYRVVGQNWKFQFRCRRMGVLTVPGDNSGKLSWRNGGIEFGTCSGPIMLKDSAAGGFFGKLLNTGVGSRPRGSYASSKKSNKRGCFVSSSKPSVGVAGRPPGGFAGFITGPPGGVAGFIANLGSRVIDNTAQAPRY